MESVGIDMPASRKHAFSMFGVSFFDTFPSLLQLWILSVFVIAFVSLFCCLALPRVPQRGHLRIHFGTILTSTACLVQLGLQIGIAIDRGLDLGAFSAQCVCYVNEMLFSIVNMAVLNNRLISNFGVGRLRSRQSGPKTAHTGN